MAACSHRLRHGGCRNRLSFSDSAFSALNISTTTSTCIINKRMHACHPCQGACAEYIIHEDVLQTANASWAGVPRADLGFDHKANLSSNLHSAASGLDRRNPHVWHERTVMAMVRGVRSAKMAQL